MKIAVIGYAASGKSTLAARLGEMAGTRFSLCRAGRSGTGRRPGEWWRTF